MTAPTRQIAVRDAIVNCVRAVLPTDLPCHVSLDHALRTDNFPAVVVSCGDDGDQHVEQWQSLMHGQVEIEMTVAIDILQPFGPDPDAAAGVIESRIQTALLNDVRLGGLATNLYRIGGAWDRSGGCVDRLLLYRVHLRCDVKTLR